MELVQVLHGSTAPPDLRLGAGKELVTHAGVPVHLLRRERSQRRSRDAEQDFILVLEPDATDVELHAIVQEVGGPHHGAIEGHPRPEVPFVKARVSRSALEGVLEKHGGRVRFVEEETLEHRVPVVRGPFLAHRMDEQKQQQRSSDARSGYPWGIQHIRADEVRGRGAGVHVYVLDTGVRTTHTEFGGRAVPTLESLGSIVVCAATDTSCAADAHGHGTHCAGTVAGTTFGVADGATIHAVKVVDDNGDGFTSWSIAAQQWILSNGVRPMVVSMSIGGSVSNAERLSLEALTSDGITVVTSAGNTQEDACSFSPAYIPSVITVASYGGWYGSTGELSWFSNTGPCVDVLAPGSYIESAWSGHDSDSMHNWGTSMSCPHVSGLAARMLEAFPSAVNLTSSERLALITAQNLTGYVYNIPADTANIVPLALPANPCAIGVVVGFPCDCGPDLCTVGQECSSRGCADAAATTTTQSAALSAPPFATTTAIVGGVIPVSAKGDPHLTNMYGQRFDLVQPGIHVFAQIPRQSKERDTLLRISAEVTRLGGACADIYIQAVNVTGAWLPRARRRGGLHYKVGSVPKQAVWHRLHGVSVKVVQGHTKKGVRYLNVLVRNLQRVSHSVGGLLGVDDHTAAAMPQPGCRKTMSL